MKRNLIVAAMIAGIVILSGDVLAQRGRHGGQGHHMMGKRLEALDLTAEQKGKLKSLRAEGQKAMVQLQADVKIARIELREVMRQATTKQTDINKAVDKLNQAQSKMTTARVNQMVKMKGVLTPEQFEKMEEMGHGRREMHGRGMMHRRGMGRGMRGELGTEQGHDRI